MGTLQLIGSYCSWALGLGLEPKNLSLTNMVLRGAVVFAASLLMVRTGDKRFFARKSAFDVILGFILASVLSRAVNGSAPFFQTLGTGFALVWMHRLMGMAARHWHGFGFLIKGEAEKVIEKGRVIEQALQKNDMSERDLLEDLRLNGSTTDLAAVEEAWMERNGDLSVIKKKG